MSLTLFLFVIALILGAAEVIKSKGQSLLAWGLVAVALGLCWPYLPR